MVTMRRKFWTVWVDPDLLDGIRRHTDGTVSYLVNRGLRLLRESLVADQDTYIPGSTAPPVVPTVLPRAVDPVSPDEAKQIVAALLARDFAEATRRAELISGVAPTKRHVEMGREEKADDAEARQAAARWLAAYSQPGGGEL
jgi:hypothetical protein